MSEWDEKISRQTRVALIVAILIVLAFILSPSGSREILFAILFSGWLGGGMMYYSVKFVNENRKMLSSTTIIVPLVLFSIGAFFVYRIFIAPESLLREYLGF